jgi:hypothetical protein
MAKGEFCLQWSSKAPDENSCNKLKPECAWCVITSVCMHVDIFHQWRYSTHLGGEDFDQRVMKYFIRQLRKEVERVKRALSSQWQVH